MRLHRRPWWRQINVDNMLKLSQIIAMLIGGLWVVYEYYTWKGYSNRLDNDLKAVQDKYADSQQRLALEQVRLSNEAAKVSAQEKRDDVELKGIQLRYAEASQRLTVRQSELANHATELSLREKGIDLDVKELDRDVALRKNVAITGTSSVKLLKHVESDSQYLVSFQFEVENVSKSPLLIGKVVIDVFVGHPDSESPKIDSVIAPKGNLSIASDSAEFGRVIPLDPPPDFTAFDDSGQWESDKPIVRRGGLLWKRVRRDAYRSGPDAFQGTQYDRIKGYLHFGGPTGDLANHEKWPFGRDLIVTAPENSYIGIAVTIFFKETPKAIKDLQISADDFQTYVISRALSDVDEPKDANSSQKQTPTDRSR